MTLTIELVPQGQWGTNLRSELPRKEWDRLRRATYKAANHRCEICGGVGRRHPVECHERWLYDNESKTQVLEGLIALCPACHEVKHIGRAGAVGRLEQAVAHLMKVNDWEIERALDYIEEAFTIWAQRSEETWVLDVSWLQTPATTSTLRTPLS
jgi:hypothetical protein